MADLFVDAPLVQPIIEIVTLRLSKHGSHINPYPPSANDGNLVTDKRLFFDQRLVIHYLLRVIDTFNADFTRLNT